MKVGKMRANIEKEKKEQTNELTNEQNKQAIEEASERMGQNSRKKYGVRLEKLKRIRFIFVFHTIQDFCWDESS